MESVQRELPLRPAGRKRRTLRAAWESGRAKEALAGYLFIAPLMLVFGVYYIYAIFRAFWMSFTDYYLVDPNAASFIGLQNYVRAFQDTSVTYGFARAGYFTLLYYLGSFLLPLLVALVLDRVSNRRAAGIYSVLIYLPAVVAEPLVYRLWRWMYEPSGGLINYLLRSVFHVSNPPHWLSDSPYVIPSLAAVSWWWSIGLMTIFFLVGLANIPQELYESARLDGANEFQVTRYIKLPLLKGTIMVWAILRVGVFAVAEATLIMWSYGRMADATAPAIARTWGWYAYSVGFLTGRLNLGYAAAIGWLGAIVMIALAFTLRRFFLEEEN